MSTLRTRLTDDMKTAMKAGEQTRLETIRLIIAKQKEIDINGRAVGKEAASDAELLSMMQGMIKQRLESTKIYRDNNRPELADKEDAEIRVIEGYMPAQLSDEDTAHEIAAIITASGATGVKDMGRVMAEVKAKFAGAMDMTKASSIVKQKLAG
jgi:uncharacterized protein